MISMFEKLMNKIERLKPFLIFSLILSLLLIGSSISALILYSLVICIGIWLLTNLNKRRRENKKISVLFFIVCVFLTIFASVDLISELLKIFMKDQSDNLRSLSRQIHVYDIFLLSITSFLFGLVLITEKAITDMGWLQEQGSDKRIGLGLKFLKMIGIFLVLMSVVFTKYLPEYSVPA